MSILQLRERIPGFIASLEDDRYRAATGHSPWPPLETRYSGAGDLFSIARITEVQRALAGASGQDERLARSLLEFTARGHALAAAAIALEERYEWAIAGSVGGPDFTVTPEQAERALAETADLGSRRRIELAYVEELADRRFLAEEILARHRDGLNELGYGSHVDALEILTGLDLRRIAREGEAFIADSQDLFDALLVRFFTPLTGRTVEDGTAGDLRRLEQASGSDGAVPGGTTYDAMIQAMAGIGLDPHAEGRVSIDRNIAGMDPVGGECYVLGVPDHLRLVVRPRAGRPAWSKFLHALGTTLHHAYTDADLPIEQRYLGDESVPAASGALFGALLGTPAFGRAVLGVSRADSREFGMVEALLRLLSIRRDIAILVYSLAFHDEGADGDFGAEMLARATGVRHDPRSTVWLVEPDIDSARRIRATQLGAIHGDLLRSRFDEDWFRNPAAGGYLRDLFSNGRRYNAHELAVQLGAPGLGYDSWFEAVRDLARDA